MTSISRTQSTSSSPAAPSHLFFGDMLRVVAALLVVTAHVGLGLVYYKPTEKVPLLDWSLAIAIDCGARWIVAGFVMLSGMFLLDPAKQESPWDFYRKRLGRVGIPLVFWSALYMVWPYMASYAAYNRPELAHLRSWHGLVLGIPYYHLHFMFLIVGLYLFTPMLRVFVRHTDRATQAITIALILLLGMIHHAIITWQNSPPNAVSRFVPYVGFFLAGWWLRNWTLSRRMLVPVILGMAGCVAMGVIGTRVLVVHWGWGWGMQGEYLSEFWSPLTVVIALGMFVTFRTIFTGSTPNHWLGRFITHWLSPATLGIYLLHPLILDLISKDTRGGTKLTWPGWMQIAVGGIATFVACFVIVAIWQRIPLIRRAVA